MQTSIPCVVVVLFVSILCGCKSNQQTSATPEINSIAIGDSPQKTALAAVIENTKGDESMVIVSRPLDVEVNELSTRIQGNKVVRLDNGFKITFDPSVLFDEDSYELKAGVMESLISLASIMIQHPKTNVIIEGHTDTTGNPQQNQILSENRAHAVADFLKNRKVPEDRIKWKGYGDTQPLFSNKTSPGRKRNRRVEIVIVEK